MSEKKNGIEFVKLSKEEMDKQKELEKQKKTAYFNREDARKEQQLKIAIAINAAIFVLAIADLLLMAFGYLPVQVGILLLIVFCVASTLVSRTTTRKK